VRACYRYFAVRIGGPAIIVSCLDGLWSVGTLWDVGVHERITIMPGKMGGQPCIRGHRFTVEHLLGLVGAGWTLEQIQEDFPFVEAADIQQVLACASFSAPLDSLACCPMV